MDKSELVDLVEAEAKELIRLMDMEDEVETSVDLINLNGKKDGETIKVSYTGDELGALIGSQGRHLRSIQYIISVIVGNKIDQEESLNIMVDAGGYLDEKMTELKDLATLKADEARIEGRAIHLNPMNAFERKMVHTTIGIFDDVYTESEGEGEERHVKIIPTSDEELGIGGGSEPEEGEEES